ncbi:RsmE family RNA methyltransferase [Erysipelothrix urinaevulpis]|uniref:16S rRNA (uracil(1498)-N(3))-methyltransferase n=1 Tax=Erysipelothrix urinaevulpis TaxID=2683717 RepID=UPI001357F8FB|nr:RsmE family RNA methyltransferase [Erysipelothrix urinaevulpis]
MQQFFIESLDDPRLSKEQIHQCQKVLRMKPGDRVRLVDKQEQGQVVEFKDDTYQNFEVIETLQFPKKKINKVLIASLIRSERLEWLIQKACELGVDAIYLYKSDHGVVRDFGQRTDRKLQRFNEIAKEASEQSYREKAVPVIGILDKDTITQAMQKANFILDIGKHPNLYDDLTKEMESVSVLIGPEGGFSDDERHHFCAMGFESKSLLPTILRAETAGLTAVTYLSLFEVIE